MTLPLYALPGLRVLLLDDGKRRSPQIRLELIRLRCQLVEVLDNAAELGAALQRLAPDLLIVDSDAPSPELLAQIAGASPRASLLYTDQAAPETLQAALQACISVVCVTGLQPQRLGAVLQLTLARFAQDQALRTELTRAKDQLAERKLIERARGILMREQGLDEEAAFQRLRHLAMDGGQTLAAVAARLIDADQLLRHR
jgi:response regulator NasT